MKSPQEIGSAQEHEDPNRKSFSIIPCGTVGNIRFLGEFSPRKVNFEIHLLHSIPSAWSPLHNYSFTTFSSPNMMPFIRYFGPIIILSSFLCSRSIASVLARCSLTSDRVCAFIDRNFITILPDAFLLQTSHRRLFLQRILAFLEIYVAWLVD